MSNVLTTREQMVRFNQAQVRAALKLYRQTGMLPSRNVRLHDLLDQASKHTGKSYNYNRQGAYHAICDLDEALNG